MKDDKWICSICLSTCTGFGNNAAPVNGGRCCDDCNSFYVIPARLKGIVSKKYTDKFFERS